MSSSQPRKDDLIGKQLGQFEILEEIGRGGMATVYRARQKSMNRIVAVKVLPRHLMHDPGFYERFEREVDVIAHLEHPHILPIYDYGQEDGVPYIAMRFLGGGSMDQLIRRGVHNIEDLEKPIRQIGQALDYAHQQGVIHRDIKPGNIMLDENGNAYLSDFGIARVLGSELTGSMIVGTPAYMSPEQANGLAIDGRADIYAMGVVLFELITGREPYQAETPMAVLLKHINEPMPPISSYRSDVPQQVQDVISICTAKDPNDRFPSASDMAKAFSAALRGENISFDAATRASAPRTPAPGSIPAPLPDSATITGMPVGAMPATGVPAVSQTGMPVTGMPVTGAYPAPPQRRTGLIAGIFLLLAVIIGGGIFAVLSSQGGDEPVATPAANLVPTPFFRADTVRGELYTISIPGSWIPPQGLYDISDDVRQRLIHAWQPNDLSAYITLELLQANMGNDEAFLEAVNNHAQAYVNTQSTLTFIDEARAPDGTLRRSYRLVGATNPAFPPGQVDMFYLNRSPYLVVLSTYSADSTGNTLVGTFQSILDSLRIRPPDAG